MKDRIPYAIVMIAGLACLLAGDLRISCFLLCACIVVLSGISFFMRRQSERQIEELTDYLMKVQDGLQLPELTKCREGQIGILESEIYKLVTRLKEQSHTAKQEKTYLAEMLSDISHQIKTPLTAITLMTDLLKEPDLPEEKRLRFVANIDSQTEKITWLIRNLLTLSRLDADMLELKKEKIDVWALLDKACQPIQLLADGKGVSLLVEEPAGKKAQDMQLPGEGGTDSRIQKETPENQMSIICDTSWTAEALSNIIKNCVEHTKEGGTVRITASQHNLATSITIRDNGTGIAKEDLPHIFERFYKGKHSSRDSVGIGLAMADQIILRQNGMISVESEEGIGTAFYIKFYRQGY